MGVDKSVCSMDAIYNCKLCEKSAMRVVEAVSAVFMCLGLLSISRPVCSSFSLLLSLSLDLSPFLFYTADFAFARCLRLLCAAQPSGLQEVLWMTLARRGLESLVG